MSAPRTERADAREVGLTEALDHLDVVRGAENAVAKLEHIAGNDKSVTFFHRYVKGPNDDKYTVTHDNAACTACAAFQTLRAALDSYAELARATAERSAAGASTADESAAAPPDREGEQ